jgi:hypothetical protein
MAESTAAEIGRVYEDRAGKARFVFERFRRYLSGRILDVGADELHLRAYLPPGTDYVGIGLGTNPELRKVDLERDQIPFAANSFDCVLCLDVLEHVENIHSIFDELCRMSRRWVIISLPNCYLGITEYARSGPFKGGPKNMKFYGLPREREADRHKWFFSSKEAATFVAHRAAQRGLRIVEYHVERHRPFWHGLVNGMARLLLGRHFDLDEFTDGTSWWVLEKS